MTDPKIDRSKTKFQSEKDDLQQLLGEALKEDDKYFTVSERTTPSSDECVRLSRKHTINALALLDNMEEPDGAWVTVEKMKELLCLAAEIGVEEGFAAMENPDDVGCPQSDAMGGVKVGVKEPFGIPLVSEERVWRCIQCDTLQPAVNERCSSCGQKRPEPSAEFCLHANTRWVKTGRLTHDGYELDGGRYEQCKDCGKRVEPPPEEPEKPRRNFSKCRLCGGFWISGKGCVHCGATPPEEPEKEREWTEYSKDSGYYCSLCSYYHPSKLPKCLSCGASMEDKQ